MSEALKPCPFCGDKMVLTKAETLVHIKQGCCIIGAMGFMSVSAWNTRADLPATNEQAFANEKVKALMEALGECRDEIDDYIRQEYPHDHPVQERCRKRDFSANPARAALAAMETKQ